MKHDRADATEADELQTHTARPRAEQGGCVNIDEMEAGPELDAAVGNAIGLKVEIETSFVGDRGLHGRVCVDKSNQWWDVFTPSHSIEDAFDAAGKCGLFESDGMPVLMKSRLDERDWVVIKTDIGKAALGDEIAIGPTPAVAICRAILKLAK
jgi:hypothetical protein